MKEGDETAFWQKVAGDDALGEVIQTGTMQIVLRLRRFIDDCAVRQSSKASSEGQLQSRASRASLPQASSKVFDTGPQKWANGGRAGSRPES